MSRLQDEWVREGKGLSGQTVIIGEPPNYDEIAARFPIRGKSVIFSYGDKVYNPAGIKVPYEILAHEARHGSQQDAYGVEDWWKHYLIDREFRLDQELEAHMVEYDWLKSWATNRHERRAAEAIVSKKLASDIYDFGMGYLELREAMRTGGLSLARREQ